MTSEQFAYWLQGFAELNEAPPSEAQWRAIRGHLEQVFIKVTPRTSGYTQALCLAGQSENLQNAAFNNQANLTC